MPITRLNGKNLSRIPERVLVPQYDRSNINSGIVHVGVGNFHRAHEAYYTDQLFNAWRKKLGDLWRLFTGQGSENV